jgi:flagellar motor switch protein FliG
MNADLRRAALLLSTLPEAEAQSLLAHLDSASAAIVKSAVAKLDAIEPAECVALIKALGQATGNRTPKPSNFLEGIEPGELHVLLGEEHPQVMAAVLAQLPRSLALVVLRKLPTTQRHNVILRIADLQPIEPEILHTIEQSLVERRSTSGRDRLSRAG